MGLYKKEVLIRPASTTTMDAAITQIKNWLNGTFQEKAANITASGSYVDYFFADIFDARTGQIIRVFSDATNTKYSMTDAFFEILPEKDESDASNDQQAFIIT